MECLGIPIDISYGEGIIVGDKGFAEEFYDGSCYYIYCLK